MLKLALIVIFIILICIALLPVRVYVRYNGKLSFSVSVFGIKLGSFGKKKKSVKKTSEKKDSAPEKEKHFTEEAASLSERIRKFTDKFSAAARLTKKYLKVDKFTVQITVGTGSAPSTAVSVGALWAAVYNIIGLLSAALYVGEPKIEITPDYNNAVFKPYAKCIISTRIVYIILIGIVILTRKGKEE